MLPSYEVEESEEAQQRSVSGQRSLSKNRSRLDTVADILRSCAAGANKSRVMLVANINSVVATEMLNKLLVSGLVLAQEEDNTVVYSATRGGLDFVDAYSRLVSMLCPGLVPRARLDEARLIGAWT